MSIQSSLVMELTHSRELSTLPSVGQTRERQGTLIDTPCHAGHAGSSIFKAAPAHLEWTSSRCLISDPPRIQEPGGRRELAALLRPVPHAAEGTAGLVLRGVTVPQRQRLRREVGLPFPPPTPPRSPTSTFHCKFHQKCFRSRCIKDFLLPCRSVITRDNIGNLLLPREHVTL